MVCNGRNTIIIDKKAARFQNIEMDKEVLSVGEWTCKAEHIFACMHCKELRNITLIVLGNPISQVTLVFEMQELFAEVLKQMLDTYQGMDVSEQNRKINGYAAAIVAKLREGINTGIVETKEKTGQKYCPVCGMQCEAGDVYCMECGAEV